MLNASCVGWWAGAPVLLDADAAVAAVWPYLWLLARVGDDGIKLTKAGYLPPVHVAAAFAELGFGEIWIGAGNREDLTVPVLDLRQSAQRLGLLRKYRGRLMATARGRQLRTDPVGLWWHLAERTPTASNDRCGYDAGLLYLAAAAAEIDADRDSLVAELLDALGWIHGDGSRITTLSASILAFEVKNVLRRMDPLAARGRAVSERRKRSTRSAIDFARTALTVWPV